MVYNLFTLLGGWRMKKSFLAGLMVWVLTAVWGYADGSSTIQTGKDASQLKKEYQAMAGKELRAITLQIRHLKHKAITADAKLRVEIRRETKKLDAKRADVSKKLSALKKSTGDAWKDLRTGLDAAMDDLKKAVEKSSARLNGSG
jgi:hypothetical protein